MVRALRAVVIVTWFGAFPFALSSFAQTDVFSVTFKTDDGKPAADAQIHLWTKDTYDPRVGPVRFGKTNDVGAIDLPKGKRAGQKFSVAFCPGPPPTIHIVEPGMEAEMKKFCRPTQFTQMTWGANAPIGLKGRYHLLEGPANESERPRFPNWVVGFLAGMSSLGNGDRKCSNANNEMTSINSALVPSCTFEARKANLEIAGGVRWTFLEGRVAYQRAGAFKLDSSATAGAVRVSAPGTLASHSWEYAGLVRVPAHPGVNIIGGGGLMHWALRNDSGFQVSNNGQVTYDQGTSSTKYAGNGLLLEGGVDIRFGRFAELEPMYQHRKYDKSAVGLHEHTETLTLGVICTFR